MGAAPSFQRVPALHSRADRVAADNGPSHARAEGGTRLVYDVRAKPRHVLGRIAAALEIRVLRRRRFESVLRGYDEEAAARPAASVARPRLAPGGRERLAAARDALLGAGGNAEVVARLCDLVEHGDDRSVERLRPACSPQRGGRSPPDACRLPAGDSFGAARAAVGAALSALPRRGHCRYVARRRPRTIHCETCRIDFSADFERSVGVTFTPTPAIRAVTRVEFCVGGPQLTPHVVAQQLVAAGERRNVGVQLERGRYRVRTLSGEGSVTLVSDPEGGETAAIHYDGRRWSASEVRVRTMATLELANAMAEEELFVVERTDWADDAATAAEVTTLQVYRDLFAAEALRADEPISAGTLTVVFTDLRESTRFYREVGDAPAFGSVLDHVGILRRAVVAQDGAVVKQMGDAIMAVFMRPVSALRAMTQAQREVAGRPLALKVGIHAGTCIAVNQNGVLDSFGSTVNLAARLVAVSTGSDLVVSDAILEDPEVKSLELSAERVEHVPKGFEGEELSLWRIASA